MKLHIKDLTVILKFEFLHFEPFEGFFFIVSAPLLTISINFLQTSTFRLNNSKTSKIKLTTKKVQYSQKQKSIQSKNVHFINLFNISMSRMTALESTTS